MERRRVGRSGLWVSVAGLGCNNFGMRLDADQSAEVVHAALDAGITFFDTAESYGGGKSEEFLGKALGSRRSEVVVATKVGSRSLRDKGPYPAGGSRRYIVDGTDACLHRLGTDWIDLLYLHYPDKGTPLDETLEAFDDLVHQGKVRYIASSNVRGWQISDAEHIARARGSVRYIATQEQWSLLRRDVEREIVPACEHFGIGVVPYFPLASGLLTGKYTKGAQPEPGTRFAEVPRLAAGYTEGDWDAAQRLSAFAADAGHSILELALSWLVSQRSVPSVIAGATSAEQVKANAVAVDWKLGNDELAEVNGLLTEP